MIGKIILGAVTVLIAMLSWSDIGLRSAAACNRTAGCAMDSFLESYDMMHSNKMNEAMAAGQANIDAFRRLRDAEQRASSRVVAK